MKKITKGILLSISLFLLSFSFVAAANYDSITAGCSGDTTTKAGAVGTCPSDVTAAFSGTGDSAVKCPNNVTPIVSGTRVYYGGTSYGGCSCTCPTGASASSIQQTSGLSNRTVPEIIGNAIKVVLGLCGTVALVIVVYAGVSCMTAGGNQEQIKKAQKWMINGVIGIVIIAAAYAITDFIIKQLTAVV